jgi:hypothetical protein
MTAMLALNTFRMSDKLRDLMLMIDNILTKRLELSLSERVGMESERIGNSAAGFARMFIANSPGLLVMFRRFVQRHFLMKQSIDSDR